MAVSVSDNPTASTPLGFTAKVAPSWGGLARGGTEALWHSQMAYGAGAHQMPGSSGQVNAEVGYGLRVGARLVGRATTTCSGGRGDDVLFGGVGADHLFGNAGDDVLFGGDGPDCIDGGPGTDTVTYAGTAVGVTVSLGATDVGAGEDTIEAVEIVIGSDGDDTIEGRRRGEPAGRHARRQ